jgi:hypothetical protein
MMASQLEFEGGACLDLTIERMRVIWLVHDLFLPLRNEVELWRIVGFRDRFHPTGVIVSL